MAHTLPRSPSLQRPLSGLIPLGFWAESPLYRRVRAGLGLGATGVSGTQAGSGGPQVCQEAGPGLGATGAGKVLLFVWLHAPCAQLCFLTRQQRKQSDTVARSRLCCSAFALK